MKKIMFSDAFQLTQAVLDGRKTQTRRIITCPKTFKGEDVAGFHVYRRMSDNAILECPIMYDADERDFDGGYIEPKYKLGEVVAVAQAYRDIARSNDGFLDERYEVKEEFVSGWANKMFVRADLMPHHIRINNVRVERLQDISLDDCLAEGIYIHDEDPMNPQAYLYAFPNSPEVYYHPREAYAALIDKTSGKGAFESNPYVFAYTFELVK